MAVQHQKHLNMNTILQLFEEVLSVITQVQQKMVEEMGKDNEKKIGTLADITPERIVKINALVDFKLEKLERFIYEYKVVDNAVKKYINFREKLAIEDKVKERKSRNMITDEKFIEKYISLRKGVMEEDIVQYMFQDVEGLILSFGKKLGTKVKLRQKQY
eukprot:snap_masked-scaffold_95-processed-gene-0.2-mRNA-1 protein AED:1.00 eAED:1.00 QI:0/0/0/0/1/1/2/0/159